VTHSPSSLVEEGAQRPSRNPPRTGAEATGWRSSAATFAGRVAWLTAFWCLFRVLDRDHWTHYVDTAFNIVGIPVQGSLFIAALWFVLSGGLRRRLRLMHVVTCVVVAISALDNVVACLQRTAGVPGDTELPTGYAWLIYPAAVGSVLACGVLISAYRVFDARLSPGSMRSAVAVLVGGLVTSYVVCTALAFAFPLGLTGNREKLGFGLMSALGTARAATHDLLVTDDGPHWVFALGGLISGGVLVLTILVFSRSARARQFVSAEDELQVRRLLLAHGAADSLGYFATRRDKAVVFSPDRRAAVTYRVEGSVCVASADPIGSVDAWPGAIRAWLRECREHTWYPAALSPSRAGAEAYVDAGLRAFGLGDEAIIDVGRYHLDGRDMAPVRQAVNRVSRAGYTIRVRRSADLTGPELAELVTLAERWRGSDTERGFSMALNRLGDPADGRCVVVTAHDGDETIQGLLNFVPWGRHGLSLDLMRRSRTAPNGLIEAMVTGVVEAGPELEVARVSLNFAVFRSVFSGADEVGAGPVTRVTDAVLGFVSRFYQLETLYRSNAKYLPEWRPRYLCYAPGLSVARAAVACGRAEGFLPALGIDTLGRRGDLTQPRPEPAVFAAQVAALEEEADERAGQPTCSEQQRVRRAKLAVLAEAGMPAYPPGVPRDRCLADVRTAHPSPPADARTGEQVSVTGRVRALRDLGGVVFAALEEDGCRLQVMLSRDSTAPALRELWRRTVDLGDLVSVTGEVGTSRRGELSVLVGSWRMAAKCLSPLPDAHTGFTDPEARIRNRSLDMIVNPDTRRRLGERSAAVAAIRAAFTGRGFTEVETPMLHPVQGGAAARPFVTRSNAYDTDLFLRIAPELYLKRLAVGGMGRVFEVNRSFRNEGVDGTHNPEFTSVEAYQAWADYTDMRRLTCDVVREVATAVHGSPVAVRAGQRYDLSGEWPVVRVYDAVGRAAGLSLTPSTPLEEVAAACTAHDVPVPDGATAGRLVLALYDALVEPVTDAPTFYVDFPVETSPLTRVHRDDPALAERWDLVAFGMEIGTAYTELIDPIEQRARLAEQARHRTLDAESMQLDDDFLAALEYAMPPTGGLGLGVDRLVMMLTGVGIRETLAFPFVRPRRVTE
jgi:lysyl-tRNA synthetase class 2